MPDGLLPALLAALVGSVAYAAVLVPVIVRRRRQEALDDEWSWRLQRFAPGRHVGTYDPSSDLATTTWRRHAP